MMLTAKFVQIAATASYESHVLYALDDRGQVWYYQDNVWKPLGTERRQKASS